MTNTVAKQNKRSKKGGALADDIGKLAVPLGLLLAKESLNKFLKNNRAESGSSRSASRVVGGDADNVVKKVGMAGGNAIAPPMSISPSVSVAPALKGGKKSSKSEDDKKKKEKVAKRA